ncbi:MAG: glycosyltransferase family 1 protein [bacterium]|nr:glycosyltransferase family 1 protein [bacterium]
MRIGIDCRMAGTGEGIGRYIEELVRHLTIVDKINEYMLVCQDGEFSIFNFQFPNNFKIIKSKTKYYSWREQTFFISELLKLKLDLVHFPNFNVPIFYPGKFVITIHDIIHNFYPGKKKSHFFHRLAYQATIRSAIKKAVKIIAVSHTTKQDIVAAFKVSPNKIEVVYEGVGQIFGQTGGLPGIKEKYGITKSYILFVGVWRQYKNLHRLAEAFDILRETHDLQLVLAGKIDPYYPEIRQSVMSIKNADDIKTVGFVPDSDLKAMYAGAQVFVLPSLVEGFGLIGIEAQASLLPVAASNIPVLKEILGRGAIYFDPKNPKDMAEKIDLILKNENLIKTLKNAGTQNILKYDWLETAKKTLAIYKSLF